MIDISVFSTCPHTPFFPDAFTPEQQKSSISSVKGLSLEHTYLVSRGFYYVNRSFETGQWSDGNLGNIHLNDYAQLYASSIVGAKIIHILMFNPLY